MKNVVKITTFTFDQTELDRRTNRAVENFKTTLHALDVIQLPFSVAIDAIVEAAMSGKKLSKYRKPILQGSIVYCYFEKENIQHLLDEVAEQEKAKYMAELEAEKQRNLELLAEQLYQQEKAKKEKTEREREQKARDQAKRDAIEYFQSLEAQ